jgi:hypothetical protein
MKRDNTRMHARQSVAWRGDGAALLRDLVQALIA